ncbi:AAA family ATPase [Vitreimonas flagellata]|uniref:AAA family ATPase n=1 Tax=Vitreimonas flagellata TaxID=2560861 RepID=UPI001074F48E|nr:AAA family ATPase [Vitreimonas flagellata]
MQRGYLFSDIDGSTQKWERAGFAMQAAMRRHDAIFAELIAAHGGFIHDHVGDSVFAIFETGDPLACALDLQLAFAREAWPLTEGLRVRVGVHASASATSEGAGAIAERIAANRVARIADCAAGGQIVASVEAVSAYGAPAHTRFVDLGAVLLKGVEAPVQIFGLDHEALRGAPFTRVRRQAAAHANLPKPMAPLLGRAQELARLAELIAAPEGGRIINVVGPAGVGKTRLVQEAAYQFSQTQPVLYLPLASLHDGEDLIGALARALNLPALGAALTAEAISEALRVRPRLLVLDNVERASPDALTAFGEFLATHRHVHAVCASRWPLEIAHTRLRVKGLAAPGPGREALAENAAYGLFAREAAHAGASLEADDRTASLFARLCDALGGLPLALQLSAAWLRYLPLDAVVERLAQHRGEFGFIFADTWAALSPDVRDKIGRLSIFRTAFSAAAAAEVAGVELGELIKFEESGLVERAAERCFILHPLLAEMAEAKTANFDTAQAHAEYFLSAPMLAPRPRGEGHVPIAEVEAAWMLARRFWPEPKLQAAGERLFYWCAFAGLFKEGASLFAARDAEGELGFYISALRANCLVHAHEGEAAQKLAAAASASSDALTRAHGLHALGNLAHARGDFDEAEEFYAAALPIRRDLHDRIGAHYTIMSMAALALARGHAAAVGQILVDALNDAHAHPVAMIHTHFFAGEALLAQGRHKQAEINFQRALELDALIEHPAFRTRLLLRMGAVANLARDRARAHAFFDEAQLLAGTLGDRRGGCYAAIELALAAHVAGDSARAKAELLTAVRVALELRSKPLVARALLALLQVEMEIGDDQAAERLREVLAGADLGELSARFAQLTKTPPRAGDDGRGGQVLLEEGARRVLQL